MSTVGVQPTGDRIWDWRDTVFSQIRLGRPEFWAAGGLIALLLCACQPLPMQPNDESGPSPSIVTDERSSAGVVADGDRLILDIHSETGIGSAQVDLNGADPDALMVRLHLNGLEEFRLTTGELTLMASVPSSGEAPFHQSAMIGDDETKRIDEKQEYRLSIRMLDEVGQTVDALPNEKGHFEISLPAALIEDITQEFSIHWIDFYR